MFDFFNSLTKQANAIIENGAKSVMSDRRFIEREIEKFLSSPVRRDMLTGEKYYMGEQDILTRKRTVIGEGGELTEVENLPNNRLVDNQFSRLVDQKTGYFLGRPFTVRCENVRYEKELNRIFDSEFLKTLRLILEDCYLGGIGWLYIFYDEEGKLSFRRFKPYEILPFWKDEEHRELDLAVRIYRIYGYDGERDSFKDKVEVYGKDGVRFYEMNGQRLIEDGEAPFRPYAFTEDEDYGFSEIPLVAFKANSKEIPLIKRVKGLQDALNTARSDFMNNIQEDCRNTILVIKNYDGEDLGRFRQNLSQYGAVKVRSIDGCDGGIDTLKVDINSENYKEVCDMLKKAIIENGGGYDSRDERFSNNPNQLNIKAMFSEIDIDTNNTETEYQSAFKALLKFVSDYLSNSGKGDFGGEMAEIIFNRDVLINESEAINNCRLSMDILSKESIIAQHPWVRDARAELERAEKEVEKERNKSNPVFQTADVKEPSNSATDKNTNGGMRL
ncbi:MAG: phage portal protein [Clostridiales bacterium]|nr:phage portal protein [Clostridiales bacterium]